MLHLPLSLLLAAPAAFQPLYADSAEATSFLKSNWNKYEENYHPNYVLDGDPKTAWVEGKDGDGVGESITIPVSTLTSARSVRLDIKNGYQKSKNLLEANGAPAKVTVRVLGPNGRPTGTTTSTLTRSMGTQSVTIPVQGGVEAVQLVIDSVTTGKKYRDTCISDIQVFVDSDVPYNAQAENAKRGALKAWIKERFETAAYFAKLPAEYPFAASRFEEVATVELTSLKDPYELKKMPDWGDEPVEVPKPAYKTIKARLDTPALQPLSVEDRALVNRLLALDSAHETKMPEAGTWMAASRNGRAPRTPDGLEFLGDAWITLSDVSFFEARGKAGTRTVRWGEGYSEDESVPAPRVEVGNELRSNAWVMRRGDGTVAAVYRVNEQTWSERAVYTETTRELLVYDEGSRLSARVRIIVNQQAHGPDYPIEDLELARFHWKEGKLASVDRLESTMAWAERDSRLVLTKRTASGLPLIAAAPTP